MIGGLAIGWGYLGDTLGATGPAPPVPVLVPRRVLRTKGGRVTLETKG